MITFSFTKLHCLFDCGKSNIKSAEPEVMKQFRLRTPDRGVAQNALQVFVAVKALDHVEIDRF